MRKITVLLVLIGLLAMFGVVSAQETEEPTDEATVEVTPEPTAASPETDVTAEVTPESTDESDRRSAFQPPESPQRQSFPSARSCPR